MTAPSDKRLIEVAFPLKQTSLDSVHEKNVRHGHISTLHIWPARRPLAAARAALIATLLPDPGDPAKRRDLCERIGGKVVTVVKKKRRPDGRVEERKAEETVGGILHWGRETENAAELDFFREEIRKAYGGRAPRVLDPFAGGGAIPLEAMRLGCEATAIDINPVAWFILKCTLEYPQRLAGKTRPLPAFALADRDLMEAFFAAKGFKKIQVRTFVESLFAPAGQQVLPGTSDLAFDRSFLEADLAWQVRAWGRWVLDRARRDLERFYPVVAGKPTVAYLWARTVRCRNCRAEIPLLKTRWLAKKEKKRVVLEMTPKPDRSGVTFSISPNVPEAGGNNAQKREHDKRLGAGTMSRAGAWCPCCGKPGTVAMTMEEIRQEGVAGRLGQVMTAVVVAEPKPTDGRKREPGKSYRLPTPAEIRAANPSDQDLDAAFAEVPFGIPEEPTPTKSQFSGVANYGMSRWRDLFTRRQLLALGTFVRHTRAARDAMRAAGCGDEWVEAVGALLSLMVDRLADAGSAVTHWQSGGEFIVNTFQRFALPIGWDFSETNPIGDLTGSWPACVQWVSLVCEHTSLAARKEAPATAVQASAISFLPHDRFDAVVTDPPYYDAIPYSDLMDFFHIWLRRSGSGLSPAIDSAFQSALGPKWADAADDGELIDDSSRHGGDGKKSKAAYEDGMATVFANCSRALRDEGRMVVVFANKNPEAWETLVSAIIRSGFAVDGSWPIQTERGSRTRALSSAALASSVWLVCRKRSAEAKPGWDATVLEEMRQRIDTQLREFWDAGIRGPDFVWAATGPALEVYSQHPVVKKADRPGELLTVAEFLRAVRRIVVDFVVGNVLRGATHEPASGTAETGLDDITTYYLLHRHDFGMDEAPAGACILYALSCNLTESELAGKFDLLVKSGGVDADDDGEPDAGDADAEGEVEEGTGATFKLKPWKQRHRTGLGEAPLGPRRRAGDGTSFLPGLEPGEVAEGAAIASPIPLIDQAHRLMHLWRDGDLPRVDQYIDDQNLRGNRIFSQLLQALVELSPEATEERSALESVMNHLRAKGEAADTAPRLDFN